MVEKWERLCLFCAVETVAVVLPITIRAFRVCALSIRSLCKCDNITSNLHPM